MKNFNTLLSKKEKRRLRSRAKIKKGHGYLRLSIFKSNRYFYAQLIDDEKGITIASASTLDPCLKVICNRRVNVKSAKAAGSLMVSRLSNKNLFGKLVFDKGRYTYTGIVSEFAGVLRNSGLKF